MNSNTDRITSTVRSTEVLVRDSINGVELSHPATMPSTIRAMGAVMCHRVGRPAGAPVTPGNISPSPTW
ncbi:hypothetical protein [Kocuria sp. CPCC 204721]|uniref:hypothetical protein n=1 Tax=Kocuria sp. CPCC 204721 TaxID=3073548 RepID=UPI0034D4FC1E